ncbi:hypothetical protein [Thioclava sp.]|uniref:hypothetical protein n=1 Tax=Thioclava sp. TaxID=1933450 RepID=UPI003242E07E
MAERENWKWWVGHDEERYHTECDTREEAAYIASEEQDGGYIVEALKPANIKISRYFDGHRFVEDAEENAYEDHGDPDGDVEIFPVTYELRKDLEDMVRAAMDAWQEKHGLVFTGFQFSASRNEEYVPASAEVE